MCSQEVGAEEMNHPITTAVQSMLRQVFPETGHVLGDIFILPGEMSILLEVKGIREELGVLL